MGEEFPVYVGSGAINKRLTDHIDFMTKGNSTLENTTPKYFLNYYDG